MMHTMTAQDIDEFTSYMPGWESDWRQLEVGQPTNRMDVIAGDEAVLQSLNLSHGIHQQGQPPRDLVTFGLPLGDGPALWSGRQVSGLAIYGFNDAGGYDCVSRPGFCGVTLSFSRERFVRHAKQLGLEPEALLVGRLWSSGDGDCPAMEDICCEVSQLLRDLAERPDPSPDCSVHDRLEKLLPERLVAAIALSLQETSEPALKRRQRGLREAIAFMEENGHRSPGIPEVCVQVGMSWRSLDRAFKEAFGIGPKRYLLNLRLTQARREFREAPNDATIADIANDWGFWHMGDFAREYRRMFSELPSETLSV